MGRDQLPKGGSREIVMDVRNERRQQVLTVTVSLRVERVRPAPACPR
jgi:hypothetical protein